MSPLQIIMVVIFVVAAFVGYKIINRVPSMLHTPLMSGTNAFSGITITGCLSVTAIAIGLGSKILGLIAIVLAMINIVGGFGVTHRMLSMFQSKKDK
ncbi:MAG TPA: NAD(P) transhydrogenase subunit alpha [Anaerolineaceae bacterium]|nr:NAD(P) transhydrogenase subunit alpha [Anaerolineaceae bacterium]HNZ14449.1 NAD(P) transhydrogenase subunit alpha [Anaerolineaceae bacterium]HOH92789.1 NAD(P) transhydrogenase subunit alpha [Anaerolineaceae bacterium]